MSFTQFPELDALLNEFVSHLQTILEQNLIGVYLQGSLTGEHPDEHGDVDFVVVLERPLTPTQLADLQTMHQALYYQPTRWAKHLEGSYFPQKTLRAFDPANEPLWYLDNGSQTLVPDKHDDTLVVRWVLRERGIILKGPSPQTLIDPISTDALKAEIHQTMVEWGQELLAKPEELNNGWRQPYVVLSYCRMLQTLQTGRIESKYSASQWGQKHLDPRWHALIQRAWQARPNQYAKVFEPAQGNDAELTYQFLQMIMTNYKESNMTTDEMTGALEVFVTDEQGQQLPGVIVEIESDSLTGTRTSVTNENGKALFRLVPPGEYSVTATMIGFKTVKQDIFVQMGQFPHVSIMMSPANVEEE